MGVVSGITTVVNLVAKAKELADKLANLELKEVIVDLQGKVLDLKEEINALREENQRLKAAPVAVLAPKESPEFKDGMYYKGAEGPFCTGCYDTQEKFVRLPACQTGY